MVRLEKSKGVKSLITLRSLILFGVLGACAFGHQADTIPAAPGNVPGPNPLVTLAGEFFEHNYVNLYAFGDGVLDSNNPVVTDTGQVRNTLGTGFDVGGGVSLAHTFSNAQLSLSYQGAYRDYQSSYFTSGTTQNLSLSYARRLTRHLSMNVTVGAGNFLYGGTFFTGQTTDLQTPVLTNPTTPETRFLSTGVSLSYQQTRRLSYVLFGDFFLNRYNYPAAIGTTGGSGGAVVNYRVTSRTTVSGTYSHSYYSYQRNVGQTSVDQVGATLSHFFKSHWNATVYGGVARTNSSGTAVVPVNFLIGNQTVSGYITGPFHQTAFIPSFSGAVSHGFRHSLFSVSAGEGIAGSGNGYFLASRSIYANGVFSYSWNGQNISFGGGAYRLSSIANTVSTSYSSASFDASYGRMLVRYVGMFVRYSYIFYGSLAPFNGVSDNRFSFGFNFSSRRVPLTLF